MTLQQANPELAKTTKDSPYDLKGSWANCKSSQRIDERLRLLEQAIAACSAGIVISDATLPDQPIIYCNEGFERITGYTRQEVLGKNCRFLQGSQTDPIALQELRNSLKEGRECHVILNNYRKDGSIFWNELTISPLRDSNGKVTHFIGIQNDITSRRSAEIERDRFFAVSLDMLCVTGFDGYLKQVNPAWEKTLGFPKEELLAKPLIEFIHPEDRESSLAEFQKLSQGINTVAFESRLLCQNGSYKWFSWNAIPVIEQESYYSVGRDITEQKQLEEALRKNEELYRTLASNFPNGAVLLFDRDFRFTLAEGNDFAKIALSKEGLIGKTIWEIFPKQACDCLEENYRAVWQGKATVCELSHAEQIYKVYILPVKNDRSEIIAGMVMTQNITKQKQTELALRASEVKFQKLAANLPGVIYQFLLRKDGSVAFPYISSGCREIYELEPQEIQQNAQLVFDTVAPDELPQLQELIATSARTLQPWHWEGRCITRTGNVKWIQAASRPEELPNGDILWDGLMIDITDRKKAEEALRQSEEQLRQKAEELETTLHQLKKTQTQLIQTEKMSSLGQMVAGIAHEINNPISFIYGNLTPASEYLADLLNLIELYRQYYPDPVAEIQEEAAAIDLDFLVKDLPKMLGSMKAGADRIREIVLSLRNFSRLDEADMKAVDLHEGLDNTLLILQHRMKQQNGHLPIQVIKEYGQLPLVECYAGQINQVFMNIISNAIDALEERNAEKSARSFIPTIRISTQLCPDKSRVLIRIYDNGIGMTEETKMRLFDPFFTTKTIGKGTGLGLAISYQIVVEKHGGILNCISAPRRGTEFKIEIPIFQNRIQESVIRIQNEQ